MQATTLRLHPVAGRPLPQRGPRRRQRAGGGHHLVGARHRQEHREHRGLGPRELETSAVGLDERPGEREPDAGGRRPRHPAVEHVRRELGRARRRRCRRPRRRSCRCPRAAPRVVIVPGAVAQRVVDEHAERLAQPRRRRPRHQPVAAPAPAAVRPSARTPAPPLVARPPPARRRARTATRSPRGPPGRSEELVEDLGEPLGLLEGGRALAPRRPGRGASASSSRRSCSAVSRLRSWWDTSPTRSRSRWSSSASAMAEESRTSETRSSSGMPWRCGAGRKSPAPSRAARPATCCSGSARRRAVSVATTAPTADRQQHRGEHERRRLQLARCASPSAGSESTAEPASPNGSGLG